MASASGQQPQCQAEKPERQLAGVTAGMLRPKAEAQQFRLDKVHIQHARLIACNVVTWAEGGVQIFQLSGLAE